MDGRLGVSPKKAIGPKRTNDPGNTPIGWELSEAQRKEFYLFMRPAIARYLFIAGVVASLGMAACSTNGNTPLSVGGIPNGVGGVGGVITGTSNTSAPVVLATTTPSPSPVPSPTPSPKGT